MLHFDLTLIVQVILFLAFLAILNRVFYRPIAALTLQRAERIEAGQRAAEESRRRAEETQREVQRQLDAARAEAQRMIAAVNKDVAAQRQTLMDQAKEQADAMVGQARDEIRSERQAAIEDLRREAIPLAMLVASKVVGRKFDNAADRDIAGKAVAAASGGQ